MEPSSRVSTSDLLPGFLASSISTMAGTACLSPWRERKTRVFIATVWVEATLGMAREIGQERTGRRRHVLEETVPRQDARAL